MDNLNFSKSEEEIFQSISPSDPFKRRDGLSVSFTTRYGKMTFNRNLRDFLMIQEGSKVRMYQSKINSLIWMICAVNSNYNTCRVSVSSAGQHFIVSKNWVSGVCKSFRFYDNTGKSLRLFVSDKPIEVEDGVIGYQIYDNPYTRKDLSEDELRSYSEFLSSEKYIL
jgi:hypothetical protein